MAIGVVQLQILPEIFQSDAANFIFFSIIGCTLLYFVLNRRSPLSRSIGANSFPLGKDNLGQHVVFKYGVFELQGRRMYMEDRHFVRGLISSVCSRFVAMSDQCQSQSIFRGTAWDFPSISCRSRKYYQFENKLQKKQKNKKQNGMKIRFWTEFGGLINTYRPSLPNPNEK